MWFLHLQGQALFLEHVALEDDGTTYHLKGGNCPPNNTALHHQQNCFEILKSPENKLLRNQIYVNIFLTLIVQLTVVKTIRP